MKRPALSDFADSIEREIEKSLRGAFTSMLPATSTPPLTVDLLNRMARDIDAMFALPQQLLAPPRMVPSLLEHFHEVSSAAHVFGLGESRMMFHGMPFLVLPQHLFRQPDPPLKSTRRQRKPVKATRQRLRAARRKILRPDAKVLSTPFRKVRRVRSMAGLSQNSAWFVDQQLLRGAIDWT